MEAPDAEPAVNASSRKFANAIMELCEASPQMTIYQSEALHTG